MLRIFVDSNQMFGPCTPRVVKYIAKSAAKNMSSLESQTMVPTATMLGRLILCIDTGALDMRAIIPDFTVKDAIGGAFSRAFSGKR
jgi:hypothetical protein